MIADVHTAATDKVLMNFIDRLSKITGDIKQATLHRTENDIDNAHLLVATNVKN